MARTGFCDSTALLDLHKKGHIINCQRPMLPLQADERRAPLRTWANTCWPIDRWQPVEAEEPRTTTVKVEPEDKWERRLCTHSNRSIPRTHLDEEVSVEAPVLFHPLGLQGLHNLHTLDPSMFRRVVELALEKLGLIWDRMYAWDMFLEMMRSQTLNLMPNTDLPRHFTDATRAVLVDWLIQVHEVMHFQEETLYLTVHLLNRCLHQIKVTTGNLQLLGMVCLFVAAKKEECILPEVSSLCFLMDHTYTKNQLLRMERKVLCGLKFDLSYCSPLHFLVLLACVACCSAKVVWMARYLLELSLLEGQCVAFLPVQLAGAALCLSRLILQDPLTAEWDAVWCLASSMHVGSAAVLRRIMHIFASSAARDYTQSTCATYIKFSSPEAMYVSRHPGIKNASALLDFALDSCNSQELILSLETLR